MVRGSHVVGHLGVRWLLCELLAGAAVVGAAWIVYLTAPLLPHAPYEFQFLMVVLVIILLAGAWVFHSARSR